MNPRAFFLLALLGADLPAQTAPETAQAALERGDPAAAIAALDPYLQTQPDDVPALFLRSVAAERAGDLTGAVLFSGQALNTQRRLQPDAKPFPTHLARHRDLFDRLVAAHPAPTGPVEPRPSGTPSAASQVATAPIVAGPVTSPSTLTPTAGLQWAVSARASSEYRATNYGANQAAGAPNVRAYGDSGNAWAPKSDDAGPEWLELTYATPVRATGVRVVQSFNPGTLMKIELIDSSGGAITVWSGPDATGYTAGQIAALEVSFPATAQPAAKVKLTLDTKRVPGSNAIDAVALRSEPERPGRDGR